LLFKLVLNEHVYSDNVHGTHVVCMRFLHKQP